MKESVKFYVCDVCGNLVGMIHSGGGELTCCGQPMSRLEPNTVDASKEKHLPVVERKEGELHIKVGSVAHPMEEAHYIEWIAVATGQGTQRYALCPGSEPAVITCPVEHAEVYAFCNLHGLWKTEV